MNRIGFREKANYLISSLLTNRHAMYVELYTNNYSTAYETLVGMIIKRFKAVFATVRTDPNLQPFLHFYDLLTPYLGAKPQFDWDRFIHLTDHTFNIVLHSFCKAADPVLNSLANLLQGHVNQTRHLFLRIDMSELPAILAATRALKAIGSFRFKSVDDNNCPITVYDEKNPILVYNETLKKIIPYHDFLKHTPLDLQKLSCLQPPVHKKILIVDKDL